MNDNESNSSNSGRVKGSIKDSPLSDKNKRKKLLLTLVSSVNFYVKFNLLFNFIIILSKKPLKWMNIIWFFVEILTNGSIYE